MALDLTALAPEARAAFIKVGERFGSDDTLAQANQTLNAYAVFGAKLGDYGFGSADAAELQDARDGLIAAGVGREAKRTSKKIDTAAYSTAMREGQGTRLRARAVLGGAKRALLALGNIAAVQKIEALLISRPSSSVGKVRAIGRSLVMHHCQTISWSPSSLASTCDHQPLNSSHARRRNFARHICMRGKAFRVTTYGRSRAWQTVPER